MYLTEKPSGDLSARYMIKIKSKKEKFVCTN